MLSVAALPASGASSPSSSPKTVWLCLPGQKDDPCASPLTTVVASPTGTPLDTKEIKPVSERKIDCFYVYPTVSDQKTMQSNLDIDPEERSIALFQAAYYSRVCRVFAPMYRQFTLGAIQGAVSTTTTSPGQAPAARTPA